MFRKTSAVLFWLAAAMLLGTGCTAVKTAGPIKAGDPVLLQYTCRTTDGRLVASTKEQAEAEKTDVQSLYFPPSKHGPVSMTAKTSDATDDKTMVATRAMSVEKEIHYQLARAVVGLSPGNYKSILIQGREPENLNPGSRYLRLATVRKREKKRRLPANPYVAAKGKLPKIGERVFLEQGFIHTVTDATNEFILVDVTPDPAQAYTQFFGTGTIRDDGSVYEVILDVTEGRVVRDRNLMGRIVSADKRRFTIDWGHPFGGESLVCDIDVQTDAKREE